MALKKEDKDQLKLVSQTAEKLLSLMGEKDFRLKVQKGKEDEWLVEIKSSNPGLLIGFGGRTLEALQLILKLLIAKKTGEWRPVLGDIDGYRQKQKERVLAAVQRVVSQVRETGQPGFLAPMSPYERRLVHLSLAEDEDLETASQGEEGERRVVVSLKK